jgi:uncharacterized protein YdhG (YjbR/CyaY superfamily)
MRANSIKPAKRPKDIDDYIAGFSEDVQAVLQKIRQTIQKAAPQAKEVISYQMPAFKLNGNLIYFAAFKKHIGMYPPVRDEKLKVQAAVYAGPKGNLRFPLGEPMPFTLISKIVKQRIKEDVAHAAAKAKQNRK